MIKRGAENERKKIRETEAKKMIKKIEESPYWNIPDGWKMMRSKNKQIINK
jgi:hypothetical protein